MRTLTLGALIVSGGTLAALPFRRYQVIPDASSVPTHVTGPTQSILDGPTLEPVEMNVLATVEIPGTVDLPNSAIRGPVSSTLGSSRIGSSRPIGRTASTASAPSTEPKRSAAETTNPQMEPSRDLSSRRIRPSDDAAVGGNPDPTRFVSVLPTNPKPRRDADAPLTYEDLAQPIDIPPMIQQRFNATTAARQQQVRREQLAGLVMPDMESLAVAQQEEIRRIAESAATTLASTVTNDTPAIERLPEPQPAQRERHWIRQPD